MSLHFWLTYEIDNNKVEVFDANITSNLTTMAGMVGIYKALWYPEKINAIHAKDIIVFLRKGLVRLKKYPRYFSKFNSPNGWGSYDNFVGFLEECLTACEQYPNAKLNVLI